MCDCYIHGQDDVQCSFHDFGVYLTEIIDLVAGLVRTLMFAFFSETVLVVSLDFCILLFN